jgi:hypothetical protein
MENSGSLAPSIFWLQRSVPDIQRHTRVCQLGKEISDGMHGRDSPVGLIAALTLDRLSVGDAREGRIHVVSGYFADPLHERLDHFENALLLGE